MYSKFKNLLFLVVLLETSVQARDGYPDKPYVKKEELKKPVKEKVIEGLGNNISVVGQGVAPSFATSPAQSYILAKKAATADAYRLLAEKIKGVRVEGNDTIENMSVKSSVIRSKVSAMINNAKIVNVTFKEGLCEVEMEIEIDTASFYKN